MLPSPKIKTNLIADDKMNFCSSINKHLGANKLQKYHEQISKWFCDRRITVNPVKSSKYLSVIIDAKLKPSHVNYTYNKARGTRTALYPMLNQHSSLPIKTKLRIITNITNQLPVTQYTNSVISLLV